MFSRDLIFILAIGLFVGVQVHASTPVGCTIAYEKLASATVFGENVQKLMNGGLVITDVKTGEKFVASATLKTLPDDNPKLFQPTTLSEIRIFAKNARGKTHEMGIVKVSYGHQTKELYIASMGVDPEFQQQGLSTLALAEIMKQFPEAKTVTGKLVGDNARQFMEGMKAASQSGRQRAMIRGFENTPFYKAVSLHGYSNVDPHASYYDPFESGIDQLYIKLRRPMNP